MEDNKINELGRKIEKLGLFYDNQNSTLKFQYEMLVKLFNNFAKKRIYFKVVEDEQYKNSKKENEKNFLLYGGSDTKSSPAYTHILFWDFEMPRNTKFIWFGKLKGVEKYTFNIKKIEDKQKIIDEIIKNIFPDILYINDLKTYSISINFDKINDYYERINEIVNKNRISKKTFIDNLDKRLDFIVKSNNIDLNNTILEEENLEDIKNNKSYSEGKIIHLKLEKRNRNSNLVNEAKAFFEEKKGKLFCEVCGFNFDDIYGKSYIEAHHKIPLSELNENTETKKEDLAMVCANCHRMLHLYDTEKCLSIHELKDIINNNKN